jgi:hypothetical protein
MSYSNNGYYGGEGPVADYSSAEESVDLPPRGRYLILIRFSELLCPLRCK